MVRIKYKCFFVLIGLIWIVSLQKEVCAAPKTEIMDDTNKDMVIALDPGHGGDEKGACYYGFMEKNLNLQLAKMVKEQLEEFQGVTVVLTRETDVTMSLKERADIAKMSGADVLISMHFNASSTHQSRGAAVYISTAEKYREEQRIFADYLLGELEAVGLDNAGTYARVTQMNRKRQDGSFDDYYGIIRNAYNNGIPGLLIEHCYLDSKEDSPYFKEKSGLEQLAGADVNGIAAYYHLKKKDGTTVQGKHAARFGETTKGIEYNYYEAPRITSITLKNDNHVTPQICEFEISVEDDLGISSIYLVYKNMEDGSTMTVSILLEEPLVTGSNDVVGYVPNNVSYGRYRLCYIGAYNIARYDAGYNLYNGELVGFGKCDWLNSFSYGGEADLYIEDRGRIEKEDWETFLAGKCAEFAGYK